MTQLKELQRLKTNRVSAPAVSINRLKQNIRPVNEESVWQSSMLNALPANIALLNSQGEIIMVNDSWKKFADGNELNNSNYGIGDNYIALCERNADADCPQ